MRHLTKKQYWLLCTLVPSFLILLALGIQWLMPKQQHSTAPTEFLTLEETEAPVVLPQKTEPPAAAEQTEPPTEPSLPAETAVETHPAPTEEATTEAPTEPETEPPETQPEQPQVTEPVLPAIQEADETVYATGDVNIRTGPGTDYEKVGVLAVGESAHRTGVTDTDWSRIEWEGDTCYVSSNYVSTEEPAPAAGEFPIHYSDGTLNLTITKEWYSDTWCYAAHVQLSDYGRLKTVCANGGYGNGYETTSGAAGRVGAVFAVNGDYSAPYLDYIVVRDGTIWNGAGRDMWMPGVYSAHTGILQSAWESGGTPGVAGANVQQLVDDGTVTDTFCFGPPVLQNGAVFVGSGGGRAQRTFIGTNGAPGDIWVVVADGRYNDGVSQGLTAEECALFLQDKGCTLGVPLDGGGSSAMVFGGEVLNAARYGQRAVVDFLVVSG